MKEGSPSPARQTSEHRSSPEDMAVVISSLSKGGDLCLSTQEKNQLCTEKAHRLLKAASARVRRGCFLSYEGNGSRTTDFNAVSSPPSGFSASGLGWPKCVTVASQPHAL